MEKQERAKTETDGAAEMDAKIEDIERQYPGKDVAEPFRHGYERGRDHYQELCNESKAA